MLPTEEREETSRPGAETAPTRRSSFYGWLVVAAFVAGIASSYMTWGRKPAAPAAPIRVPEPKPAATSIAPTERPTSRLDAAALMEQVNPAAGYELPARYGDLGPRLLAGGAIDYAAFAAVYDQGGSPLTAEQIAALKAGSDQSIVITPANAHFLLNFFWAVGLANKNPILTDGPMVQNSGGKIEQFASTGGWTLGARPVKQLYASMDLIPLNELQQSRVEEVASSVYRPCCGNATLFPDCNHGMAMLGLLELMASQDASVEQMFTAAKYVNAYWFPQQALETALYLKATRNVDFSQADPRLVTGDQFSSGQGSARIHAALQAAGQLPKAPDGGGSCGS